MTDATAGEGQDQATETAAALRAELRDLGERRQRGDIPDRRFQRRSMDLSVALARAEARSALPEDEPILAEHHIVHSHFKLTESLLKEPEQATVSLFATAERLVRVRGKLALGAQGLGPDLTTTWIDSVGYAAIRRLDRRAEWRWGEVGTGLVIVLLALLLRGLLTVTGPVLVLLGLAGMAHGLLMPTRWIEIATEVEVEPHLVIHGAWRKSGRRLVGVLRRGLRTGKAR